MKKNTSLSNDYTTFNSAIFLAAKDTATREITKSQGRFHHYELILLPTIQHRDNLLYHLRSKYPSEDTTAIKDELRASQNVVNDYVYLAKAAWSTHQSTIIYNMLFTPKDAWESVNILAVGMTCNYKN